MSNEGRRCGIIQSCGEQSIVFQEFGGWDIEDLCDFEQGFKRDATHCAGAFDLREIIQTSSDQFRECFLRVTGFLSIVSNFQTHCDVSFGEFGVHSLASFCLVLFYQQKEATIIYYNYIFIYFKLVMVYNESNYSLGARGMDGNVCCFLGHRKIQETDELRARVEEVVRELIGAGVDTFLFGSKSAFDDLCHEIVSEIREEFPYLKRVYVRAEFPHINEDYTAYLLRFYEETYFPPRIERAGRAVYVERNFEMIEKSKFCVVYYDPEYSAGKRRSGTAIAVERAKKRGCVVLNLFDGV